MSDYTTRGSKQDYEVRVDADTQPPLDSDPVAVDRFNYAAWIHVANESGILGRPQQRLQASAQWLRSP